jgi:hypothetical protein
MSKCTMMIIQFLKYICFQNLTWRRLEAKIIPSFKCVSNSKNVLFSKAKCVSKGPFCNWNYLAINYSYLQINAWWKVELRRATFSGARSFTSLAKRNGAPTLRRANLGGEHSWWHFSGTCVPGYCVITYMCVCVCVYIIKCVYYYITLY